MERRLAAILMADMVGYSRLMSADEVGTLEALKTSGKNVLRPLVAKHRGRIVKFLGDGAMVEFASAVDAVECAITLEAAIEQANNAVPEDRPRRRWKLLDQNRLKPCRGRPFGLYG